MATKWINAENTKISKEELYHILRRIVWYESSQIDPTWRTSIFHWIDCAMLLRKLLKHKIGIIEFNKGETIIPEGRWDCNFFFLLLKWELWIYKKNKKDKKDKLLTNIKTISVVWEIWFLTKSERTATVKANCYSYLLPLDQFFIDSLPVEAQVKIYRNLAIETWRKLDSMNRNTCIKACLLEGLETTPENWEVQEVVKDTIWKLEVIELII